MSGVKPSLKNYDGLFEIRVCQSCRAPYWSEVFQDGSSESLFTSREYEDRSDAFDAACDWVDAECDRRLEAALEIYYKENPE